MRLDPKEARFDIQLKAGKEAPVKLDTKAEPGRYYLISKRPSGGYRALSLGTVPPPATKKGAS